MAANVVRSVSCHMDNIPTIIEKNRGIVKACCTVSANGDMGTLALVPPEGITWHHSMASGVLAKSVAENLPTMKKG